MNFLEIVQKYAALRAVAPVFGKAMLKAKTYSPELCVVGGITAGLYAGYSFAQARNQHDEVFEEILEEVKHEQRIREQVKNADEDSVEEQESLSDTEMMQLYGEVAGRGIKLYGPTALLTITSIALILKGHGLLKGRNKALMAGMVVLEKSFQQYRARVIEQEGEEADERYLHGAEVQNVVEGKGKDKKKSKRNTIPENGQDAETLYGRVFDENNVEYGGDRDMNRYFLQINERHLNDLLNLKGYVMLNDVYRALNMKESPEGAVVGWSLHAKGDDFIDFGLNAPINQNEGDNRFVLNFNCNGVVFEYINQGG